MPPRSYIRAMADSCCDRCHEPAQSGTARRRVLWIALIINAAMFAVEIGAGLAAGSASLQADALDFLGDAANYICLAACLDSGEHRIRFKRCRPLSGNRQHGCG